MTINAINTNENKNRYTSYLKAAALGGAGGYMLKQMLPIAPQEKDERYFSFLDDLEKQKGELKRKEIEVIRNSQKRTPAEDVFISLVNKNEVKASKIKALQEPLASEVVRIINQINNKARIAKETGKEVLTAVTKHIRPTKTFVGVGMGAGLAATFLKKTLGHFTEKPKDKGQIKSK